MAYVSIFSMQSSETLLVVPIWNCFNIVPEALARVACPSLPEYSESKSVIHCIPGGFEENSD